MVMCISKAFFYLYRFLAWWLLSKDIIKDCSRYPLKEVPFFLTTKFKFVIRKGWYTKTYIVKIPMKNDKLL